MSNKPLIKEFIHSSDKKDQAQGNKVVSALLDNGSKLYYFNVKYKMATLHITYPNGNTKTFTNNPMHQNFSNTKYSEAMKQVTDKLLENKGNN